ncbi:hypothetical protein AVEN_22458-1 [Araneus ventricosus]|uniref:Uncharacterized protein n=1 Tax=Araneus ventricosus TaxID=182803 RepID=A0A4Y2NQJ3_ARAVE|nr:hypothetical protein AVEN_22458-1 [Araneus ventricosus]
MVSGCSTFFGVGSLVPIDTTYHLNNSMLPTLWQQFGEDTCFNIIVFLFSKEELCRVGLLTWMFRNWTGLLRVWISVPQYTCWRKWNAVLELDHNAPHKRQSLPVLFLQGWSAILAEEIPKTSG